MKFQFRIFFAQVAISAFLLANGPARAFETAPHFDMTRDALSTEGFGETAIRVVQVSNWFNDLYEQDDRNAFSGHQSWNTKEGFFGNLLTLFRKENWSKALVDAAELLHFDSSNPIDSQIQAQTEWYRLARKTRELMRDCARRNDIEGMLVIMGMTLHALQDFYTHSNWIEPKGDRRVLGGSGPGWARIRTFGSHPTFFDVPEAERAKEDIYSQKLQPNSLPGNIKVGHGGQDTPSSGMNLASYGMNKDSLTRPYYEEAYTTAYIATRQWVQAMRSWVQNDAVWSRLQQFANTHGGELDHDQRGAFELSWHVGRWNGNEGVKSSIVDIGKAGIRYFDGRSKSFFRGKWETLAVEMVKAPVTNEPAVVPSSAQIAANTSFVVLRITRLHQFNEFIDIDPGKTANYYFDANIGGQMFRSCIINGHDTFTFPPPNAPITFIKAVPPGQTSVPIRLQLWDDDLFTSRDQADICPVKGRLELRFSYSPRTAQLSGDVSGIGTKKARGFDNDNHEITLRMQTMPVIPPPVGPNVLQVAPSIQLQKRP